MKLRTNVGFISALAVALLSGAFTASAFTPQSEQDRARGSMYQRATGLI